MPQRTFELTTFAPVPAEFAFRFLSDLNNHRYLHPFFVRAEQVGVGSDASGRVYRDFMVTERPNFAFVRYTIHFPTRMFLGNDGQFTSEVKAALGTSLVNVMRCAVEGQGTRITESVTVAAPAWTLAYVRREAFTAHSQTFRRLPEALQSRFKAEAPLG